MEMVPYMMIVGPRDAENQTVSVRDRLDGDLGALPIADAIERLRREADSKIVRQKFQESAGISDQTVENEY